MPHFNVFSCWWSLSTVVCLCTYERIILPNVDTILSYAERTIIILVILIVGSCLLVFCLSMYVRNIILSLTDV